jgi:gliding motility-associated-like protein
VVTFIGSGITSLDFPNTFVASNGAVPDTVYRNIFATICLTPAGYVLTPDTTGLSYQWGNGASTPTLAVTAFGKYWCRISSGCNVHIDTFIVHGDSLHTVTNAQDVKICHSGDTVKLVAHAGYSSYLWQDSTTNSYYIARAPGNYHVAYSGYCTQYVDTFRVRLNPLFFTLGPDVTVCSNYTIVPSIKDSGITYKWQDGYTGPTYSASHTGNYFVAINQDGCVAVDTVKVTFFHFSQNIPDTFICEGTPINLNLTATPPAGGKVLWNDGTTSPIKNIRESGTYWVYVSKDECEILDTVRVTTALCNCWHYLPTAFTPNGDGLNDIVRPVIQPGCNVSGYQFSIYNRWGELVFSSEIPGKGWDGMYKGEPADMGVYMYSLQFFTGVYDKQSAESGSITLIR